MERPQDLIRGIANPHWEYFGQGHEAKHCKNVTPAPEPSRDFILHSQYLTNSAPTRNNTAKDNL
jgi:hypothetical protein